MKYMAALNPGFDKPLVSIIFMILFVSTVSFLSIQLSVTYGMPDQQKQPISLLKPGCVKITDSYQRPAGTGR